MRTRFIVVLLLWLVPAISLTACPLDLHGAMTCSTLSRFGRAISYLLMWPGLFLGAALSDFFRGAPQEGESLMAFVLGVGAWMILLSVFVLLVRTRSDEVELTFTSVLTAPPEHVWHWITSVDGIARELAPVLKMTAPRGVTDIADVDIELGRPLFRSWVRSHLPRARAGPGVRRAIADAQHEAVGHERHLEPSGAATLITDRLIFRPRLAVSVTRWFIRRVFDHRHRGLRAHFGVSPLSLD